ncbi:MAG: leucine-rich repeat domain-containing protein [Anaerovoracaceae bacterium]
MSILSKLSDKVTTLNISNNQISELPAGMLDNMTNLVNFYAEDNIIEDIPAGFF